MTLAIFALVCVLLLRRAVPVLMFAPTYHFLYIERWSEISSLDFLFNTVKSFSIPKRLHCAVVKLCSSIRLCSKAKQNVIDLICFLYSFLLHSVAAMLAPLIYDHNNKTLVQGNYMDLCVQPSNQICNNPWGYIQQYMQSSVWYTSWWSMVKHVFAYHHISPISIRHLEILRCLKSWLLASGELADESTNKRRTFRNQPEMKVQALSTTVVP